MTTDHPELEPALPGGKVEFIEYHRPVLQAGDYSLSVEQTVRTRLTDKIRTDNTFSARHTFEIAAERFTLAPTEMVDLFPPAGSLGDHTNVLPHVVLKRSTMPWERQPFHDGTSLVCPWLALLILGEGEPVDAETVSLGSLQTQTPGWPGASLEGGQLPEDRVQIIRCERQRLEPLLPSLEDLAYTAHVRHSTDAWGAPTGEARAVVMANRLPSPGVSTAYLVSLEGRWTADGFDWRGAGSTDPITLVALHSWRFFCPQLEMYRVTPSALEALRNREQVPEAVLIHLAALTGQNVEGRDAFLTRLGTVLSESDLATYRDVLLRHTVHRKETLKALLLELDREPSTLRLAKSDDRRLESYLSMGATALPHTFRQGSALMSWYHGPLVPGRLDGTPDLPVKSADALLHYDPSLGMLETSYAAAWELGRLLALRNKSLSWPLYNWKRAHAQHLRSQEQTLLAHLPYATGYRTDELAMPEELERALFRLSLLHDVPFQYLVPDERMLPEESIRFFQIDPVWIQCLLDGAFSIGRVLQRDQHDDAHHDLLKGPVGRLSASGFLLRSQVVSGWPDLQVEGYASVISGDDVVPPETPQELLRRDRLSPNVMLCLFAGQIQTVDLHLKSEALHLGLEPVIGEATHFIKELRNNMGETIEGRVDPVPWMGEPSNRVVDLAGLAQAIMTELGIPSSDFTAAHFALEMIEGVEKVRFRRQSTASTSS